MKVFNSSDTRPTRGDETLWVYNGIDVGVTRDCFDALLAEGEPGFSYTMPRAMQGPAATMMLRGVLVDHAARQAELSNLSAEIARYEYIFSRLTKEGWNTQVNWRSHAQLKDLFYSTMKIPPVSVYNKQTKQTQPAVNREALEQLSKYELAKHLVDLVLELRGAYKLKQVLETNLSPDGRLRCFYMVAGTMTGRWSSRETIYGDGTNLQNITDRARRIFIPDPGKVLVQVDLAQAESRAVAAISGDIAYREACDSGDLHTTVCRMVWPNIGWPSNPAEHKSFADSKKYYRHFSYRDMAKRAGHASNYGATPRVLAAHLKIETRVAEDFQKAYFRAFPGIKRWHNAVAAQLATDNTIRTALGRVCHFYGHSGDTKLLKSAIAYEPQSLVGDILNLGLYTIWKNFDLPGKIELLLQVHDAVCFQVPIESAQEIIPRVLSAIQVPVEVYNYKLVIPAEATWGHNWGKAKFNKDTNTWDNPAGLREFKPGVPLHAKE